MKNDLFVYGTLHPERAPDEIAADVKRFISVGEGYIRGELKQLPEYPAVKRPRRAQAHVRGQVFRLPNDPELLARLDAYEDFQPRNPKLGLFRRERVVATLTDGSKRKCWVYIYNRDDKDA